MDYLAGNVQLVIAIFDLIITTNSRNLAKFLEFKSLMKV